MQNVNRFQGPDGKLLPIVEELKKEVETSKQKLNAGKTTTKEKSIDEQIAELEKKFETPIARTSVTYPFFGKPMNKKNLIEFIEQFDTTKNNDFNKLQRLYLEKIIGEKITFENFIDKTAEYVKQFKPSEISLKNAVKELKEKYEYPQERLFNDFHKEVQLRDTSNNPVMKCKNFDDLSNLFGKYDIQLTDKFKKLNFEAVQKVSTGMVEFMNDFPLPKEYKIPRLAVTSRRVIMCVTAYKDWSTVQIDFSNKDFSSMKNLKEQEKNEFFHAGDGNSNAESFGYHEMAHVLDNMLRHYNLSSSEKICKIAYKNIKEKGLKGLSYEASQKTISQYATENVHELFAEAFADTYLYGNNASPLSLEIVKLAKQEYNYLMKDVIKNDN